MRIGRLALASLVLFLVAVVWNGIVHLIILREANAWVAPLRRADSGEFLWLSLLMTLGVVTLFALGYSRFVRTGRLGEGVGYGLFIGVLAGLLVDLNQYLLYPIPGTLAFYWFVGGLLEFSLYGALMTRLFPVRS